LVLFFLGDPKELLVEGCEYFADCAFLGVGLDVLRGLDGCVQHLHYELRVVTLLLYQQLLLSRFALLDLQVLADLDTVGIDEIVLLITHPVDLRYGLQHPRRPTRSRRLRVAISQVDEDVAQHAVHLNCKIGLHIFSIESVSEQLALAQGLNSLPDDRMHVQHHVLRRILLGLVLSQFSSAKEIESNGDYITYRFHEKFSNLLEDRVVQPTAHHRKPFVQYIGSGDFLEEVKFVLENLVAGLQQ
jgi:hypothetical protein